MAHYAFLDSNNIVTEVITGNDENNEDWETFYGNLRNQVCKRTSYNTCGGVHALGGNPFRKNYAGIGYMYDSNKDAFIPPKPFSAWVLNETTCLWDAPFSRPNDAIANGGTKRYDWDEATNNWVEIQ